MVKRSKRRQQSSFLRNPADPSYRELQEGSPFLYANCGLGFFPADQVDFRGFAKGHLVALVILASAASALFRILSLIPSGGHNATKLGELFRILI